MANTCNDCFHIDLGDTKDGEHYCTQCRKYRKPTYRCSDFKDREEAIKEAKEASKSSGNGYQRAGAKCYITTIICEILGYPDDCEVLQILRGFREDVLKMDPRYLHILYEYDQVGPVIAEALSVDTQKERLAMQMLRSFLIPCTLAIKAGNYDEAIAIYTNMVGVLKSRFGIIDTTIDYSIETPLEDLGKARCRVSKHTLVGN